MIFYNNICEINEKNFEEKKLTTQIIQKMNLNQDTIIQAIGNLFLISTHLTSSTKKIDPEKDNDSDTDFDMDPQREGKNEFKKKEKRTEN